MLTTGGLWACSSKPCHVTAPTLAQVMAAQAMAAQVMAAQVMRHTVQVMVAQVTAVLATDHTRHTPA